MNVQADEKFHLRRAPTPYPFRRVCCGFTSHSARELNATEERLIHMYNQQCIIKYISGDFTWNYSIVYSIVG